MKWNWNQLMHSTDTDVNSSMYGRAYTLQLVTIKKQKMSCWRHHSLCAVFSPPSSFAYCNGVKTWGKYRTEWNEMELKSKDAQYRCKRQLINVRESLSRVLYLPQRQNKHTADSISHIKHMKHSNYLLVSLLVLPTLCSLHLHTTTISGLSHLECTFPLVGKRMVLY